MNCRFKVEGFARNPEGPECKVAAPPVGWAPGFFNNEAGFIQDLNALLQCGIDALAVKFVAFVTCNAVPNNSIQKAP
jgi:hypothetical protein